MLFAYINFDQTEIIYLPLRHGQWKRRVQGVWKLQQRMTNSKLLLFAASFTRHHSLCIKIKLSGVFYNFNFLQIGILCFCQIIGPMSLQ